MSSFVLLDTGIVGSFLSEQDRGGKKWTTFILEIIKSLKDPRCVIPTPVWFEIAQWHSTWHKKIQSQIDLPSQEREVMYQFVGHSIVSKILMDAALYSCEIRGKQNKENLVGIMEGLGKKYFVDAIIAAYCLNYNHYLLTFNQSEFPDKFFDVVAMRISPRGTALKREFAFLLQPKTEYWKQLAKS